MHKCWSACARCVEKQGVLGAVLQLHEPQPCTMQSDSICQRSGVVDLALSACMPHEASDRSALVLGGGVCMQVTAAKGAHLSFEAEVAVHVVSLRMCVASCM
jgi:hypothetical protein